MAIPSHVTLVEVGPRDGLQNETVPINADTRVTLIKKLMNAGLNIIEAGAFVSPEKVPQMSDTAAVLSALPMNPKIRYPVLVPNLHGYKAAISAGATDIALLSAASEMFSQRNTNCSIDQCFIILQEVAREASRDGIKMRGYISCALGCPYQGMISTELVADISERLLDIGCYQVSLGDTIGVGTPNQVRKLIDACARRSSVEDYAVHLHDTYGQALVNIYASLESGITTVDTSIAGLGGCPYAPGAAGNVATEEVVYMLDGLNIETGVSLEKLIDAAAFISEFLGRTPDSRLGKALLARRARD